jgi:hypothetical protein
VLPQASGQRAVLGVPLEVVSGVWNPGGCDYAITVDELDQLDRGP